MMGPPPWEHFPDLRARGSKMASIDLAVAQITACQDMSESTFFAKRSVLTVI